MKTVEAVFLPGFSYEKSLNLMKFLSSRVESGENEVILMVEHPPVITMGRRASQDNLLFSEEEYKQKGIEVKHISRGGDVTFHGPGQLVGYPIFKIGRKVREHVDSIFSVLKDILALTGIQSEFEAEHPGLWVENKKIAAVGIEVKNGISTHGFALNVFPEFDGFSMIIPCGISDRGTVYWAELTEPPPLEEIARIFAKRLANKTGKKLKWHKNPEDFFESINYTAD